MTAGKKSRTLDIPGEMEYTGRGVSYCATCDGPFIEIRQLRLWGAETVLYRQPLKCP